MGPPISGASGDCTALGHHAFGELSICVAPERSLDWPEVVRQSLGCTRLLMVESSVLAVTKLLHRLPVALSSWCPSFPRRSPASTLAVSQGPLGPLPYVFLVFPLCNLIWNPVVLACKRTSVPPFRQEARGQSKGKSAKAKYRVGTFPASWLKFKVSPPKDRWDYYGWLVPD